MRKSVVIPSLFALAALAGCGSSSSSSSTSTGSTTAPAAPAAPATKTAGSTVSLQADPSGQLAYVQKSANAKAGKVTINFTNSAPVPHNVNITGNGVTAATPTFSGGSRSLSVTLKPGTYTYFCSVPGHRAAGMQGTLTVS